MAISVSKEVDALVNALVLAHNSLQSQTVADGYHRDLSQVTTGSFQDPSTIVLTTLQVAGTAAAQSDTMLLANQELAVLHMHFKDAQAHLIADTVNDGYLDGYSFLDGYLAASSVTQLASLIVNLNAMKALFNVHRSQAGVHVNNDTGYATSAADATDLASAKTLALDLKAKINGHINNAGSSGNAPRINIVPR
jgi:hypothetical protein